MLKAGKPNKVEISETSPFYNYEFYIIPDESGKVNLNSVIIAERIYEEKEEHIKILIQPLNMLLITLHTSSNIKI